MARPVVGFVLEPTLQFNQPLRHFVLDLGLHVGKQFRFCLLGSVAGNFLQTRHLLCQHALRLFADSVHVLDLAVELFVLLVQLLAFLIQQVALFVQRFLALAKLCFRAGDLCPAVADLQLHLILELESFLLCRQNGFLLQRFRLLPPFGNHVLCPFAQLLGFLTHPFGLLFRRPDLGFRQHLAQDHSDAHAQNQTYRACDQCCNDRIHG